MKSEAKGQAGKKKGDSHRWFWDALEDYLAKKNLKETRQRRRIVELFLGLNAHTSAEDLHEATRKEGQNVGLATVYRTLNMLADAGLVEQKSFGEGRQVFEIKHPDSHHDHLICLDCGAVFEFENEEIEEIQERVATKHGFKLTSHTLDLYGRCQKSQCENRPGPS
jgi:Fur family ferric uptake transcriptional regulator